jgi:membrane protein
MVIKGFRVGPLLRKTGKEVLDDGILGLAAQTAYYFFFSLFPLFLFAAPLLSFVGNKVQIFNWMMGQLAGALPADALGLIRGVLKDVVFSPSAPGIMSVGALLAAYAGSNVFGSLMDALNRAYDVEETRPWWKKKLIALASVAAAGVFMMLATVIMLGGPEIATWLEQHMGFGKTFKTAWMILQYPLALILLIAMFWMIYRFLPNLRQSNLQILVGAVVGTVLWILVTLLFRLYVTNFASYNKTYGTIGGVIILLTWMYYTMLVILVGGELASELHHGTGAIEPRRGAVYAGRVVTSMEPSRSSDERVGQVKPLRPRGA